MMFAPTPLLSTSAPPRLAPVRACTETYSEHVLTTIFETALTLIAALVAATSAGVILATLRSAMNEKRREIALDHQRKALLRAKQFTAALDVPANPPPEARIT